MTTKPNINGCIDRAIEALEAACVLAELDNDPIALAEQVKFEQSLKDLKALRDAVPMGRGKLNDLCTRSDLMYEAMGGENND